MCRQTCCGSPSRVRAAGRKGATLQHPGWAGSQIGSAPTMTIAPCVLITGDGVLAWDRGPPFGHQCTSQMPSQKRSVIQVDAASPQSQPRSYSDSSEPSKCNPHNVFRNKDAWSKPNCKNTRNNNYDQNGAWREKCSEQIRAQGRPQRAGLDRSSLSITKA
jgi:hypothetical protein